MDYVAGHVAPYKKVRRVEFIDVVPKSASGKILRRELRDREQAGAAAGVAKGARGEKRRPGRSESFPVRGDSGHRPWPVWRYGHWSIPIGPYLSAATRP
jgi:hypothetical protein